MLKKVVELLLEKSAGVSLLCAALLALMLLVVGPSSANAAAVGTVTTNHWKNGSSQGYTVTATVTLSEARIATVTMTSPKIAASTQLIADNTATVYTATVDLTSAPAVNDVFAINVDYLDANLATENLTPKVTGVLSDFATPTGPVGALAATDTPSFVWNAPLALPTGGYRVALTGSDIAWVSADLDPSQTSATYSNTDPLNAAATTPGTYYDWSIFSFDSNGNSTESRSTFMVGVNFTGKVTTLNGAGIPGVPVYVFSSDLNQQPVVSTTLANGTYMYGGLASSGSYFVSFDNATYYNNGLNFPGDPLPLTAGVVTTGINAVIGGWGSITGNMFLLNGTAAKPTTAQVALYDANRVAVASVPVITVPLIDGFGSFEMSLIPPGSYNLRYSAQGYATVWNPVTVTADVNTSGLGVDANLAQGFSGKPGDGDGNGTVSIAEVQSAINMYLGLKPVAGYVDLDGNNIVSISEVQKCINAYLGL